MGEVCPRVGADYSETILGSSSPGLPHHRPYYLETAWLSSLEPSAALKLRIGMVFVGPTVYEGNNTTVTCLPHTAAIVIHINHTSTLRGKQQSSHCIALADTRNPADPVPGRPAADRRTALGGMSPGGYRRNLLICRALCTGHRLVLIKFPSNTACPSLSTRTSPVFSPTRGQSIVILI